MVALHAYVCVGTCVCVGRTQIEKTADKNMRVADVVSLLKWNFVL